MRIALYWPDDHEQHPGGVAAYRLGRIEDGVHNAPIGHDPVPFDEFVSNLLEQAKADYPDADVRLERLVKDGQDEDGLETSRWIPFDEFDPEVHEPVGPGVQLQREITVGSKQKAAK